MISLNRLLFFISTSFHHLFSHFSIEAWKQRVQFVKLPRNITAIVDFCKVADVLVVVFSPDGTDDFGELVMSCIKSVGIPSVIGVESVSISFD